MGVATDMRLEVLSCLPVGPRRATPLLFVHGICHAAWCWEPFLTFFAGRGYASYALSLRGHGASESRGPLRFVRIRDYVHDVAQVAQQLPATPVVLGHSMGGLVVQHYIQDHPVAGTVLLASVPPREGAIGATLRVARRHPLRWLKANLTWSLYPLVEGPKMTRSLFFSDDTPEADVSAYAARMQDESYLAYLDLLGLDLPRPRAGARPMLVVGAEDDRLFNHADVARTARAYGVPYEIVPGIAHDVMLDHGWERVAELIAAWLDPLTGEVSTSGTP